MSDKNEISESKKEFSSEKKEKIKISDIKSKCILENICGYLNQNSLYRIFKENKVFAKFNLNSTVKEKTVVDILEKRKVAELKKWFPYLKYMYQSLSKIANKLSDSILVASRNDKDSLTMCEVECIESIVHLLTVELVFCIMYRSFNEVKDNEAEPNLSNKISSKLQNKDEKTQKETIEFSIIDDEIKTMLGFDDEKNCIKNKNLYEVICGIVKRNHIQYNRSSCVDSYGGFEDKVIGYAESITKDKMLYSFWDSLYGIFLRLTCLNDENRNYITKRYISSWASNDRKKRRKEFDKRLIFKLNMKMSQDENYKRFVNDLKQDGVLYSFVFGSSDYDIGNYPDPKLFDVIKDALPKQQQKDKFTQFLESKHETSKNIKKEEPKPKQEEKTKQKDEFTQFPLNKDELKSKIKEQKKQEQPKQEKDKSKCQIF